MKISVIVTAYNLENYIDRCLESIICQTYPNLEIIVVDDGSWDRTSEICDSYALRDSRVKVMHQKNSGSSAARNVALSMASGEYIGFVDGDDYIKSDMYETLLNACVRHNADIAMCGRIDVYEGNQESCIEAFTFHHPLELTGAEALEGILTRTIGDTACWDKLYRQECLKNRAFPVGVAYDDIVLIPVVVAAAQKIVHIGEPKYFYVQRADSICRKPFNQQTYMLVEQSYKLLDFIKHDYPALEKKAVHFKNKSVVSLLSNAFRSRPLSRDDIKKIRKIIMREMGCLLTDPYLGMVEKAALIRNCTTLILSGISP